MVKIKKKIWSIKDEIHTWEFKKMWDFGFITPRKKAEKQKDVYVGAGNIAWAESWDFVEYQIIKMARWDKKAEARITKILENMTKWLIWEKITWIYECHWNFGFIKPLCNIHCCDDFYVFSWNKWEAQDWDKVEAVITRNQTYKTKPEAKITKVLEKNIAAKNRETLIWIISKTKTGLTFVDEEGKNKWYFVHETKLNKALHGDKVTFFVKEFKWRLEAEVVEVIKRSDTILIWKFEEKKWYWFVTLEDDKIWRDVFILKSKWKNAQSWDIVWVKIVDWEKWKSPTWEIIKVLWNKQYPGLDIDKILLKHRISEKFEFRARKEAFSYGEEINPDDISWRVDLRNEFVFTIDWIDAKDLDDAVSITKLDSWDYNLKVHIADVAHYVKEDSFLDAEAIKRGTSIYLPDRVVPMLPPELSNGLCSLHEQVDRLAMTCDMIIWPKWAVKKARVYESVINSNYRLSYDFVRDFLEMRESIKADEKWNLVYQKENFLLTIVKKDVKLLKTLLTQSNELRLIIEKYKKISWVLDFDFPESKIKLDKNWKATEIIKQERHFAHKIVEEFMICANEAVSKLHSDLPFLYRIHPVPKPEDIEKLKKSLAIFGYNIKKDDLSSKDFKLLLNKFKEDPREDLLNKLVLRSLSKAIYSDKNEWHFWLALDFYSHFTSPIRRYPDLQIHRIIKQKFRKTLDNNKIKFYKEELPKTALNTSELERNAEKIEYEAIDMKKAEFMENKIWETYEGQISWVISAWIFVSLNNTVEGFISKDKLWTYAAYSEDFMNFHNSKTKESFTLWDKIKIKVESVDKQNWRIYFEIV